MLDLKTLKVFITVADLANMTAAAKRLGLSQSAVSQAIPLEETVGAVLVDREGCSCAAPDVAGAGAASLRGGALVAERRRLGRPCASTAVLRAQMF